MADPAVRNAILDDDAPAAAAATTTSPAIEDTSAEELRNSARIGTMGKTPTWNANSYFSPLPGASSSTTGPTSPTSPTNVAHGAKTGAELLRRLSLVDRARPDLFEGDPRDLFPDLNLTGNLISATVCLPYKIAFGFGGTWNLESRRGTSALFDSFSHLSSDRTPWNHTLVGWTGEILPTVDYVSPAPTPGDAGAVVVHGGSASSGGSKRMYSIPLNKSSAPVPVNGVQTPQYNPYTDGLTVTEADRVRLETMLQDDTNGRIRPVWLGEERGAEGRDLFLKDQGRWRRYAEHELYTLFHYKQHGPDDGRSGRQAWADYVRMNERFADCILEIYTPGDLIWVHDYHLMLLPSMLRQRVPDIYLGYFQHVPFPSSEFVRCLPRRNEILTGVLGATMVGFQSYSYARHFNSCCRRILGFDTKEAGVDAYGAHVAVDIFPIGIDVAAVQQSAFADPVIDQHVAALRQLYAGKKIIVGRDRMDTVRGVAQKFLAFERFLEKYAEWRGHVVLIQVTSPTSIEEEKEDGSQRTEHNISSIVSRINGEFGSLSYSPIQHYPQYLSPQEYFALLRVADVALITSVRDGMNTTSLEYVICQKHNQGPLILSEFSGTAGSLGHAIHINPWDHAGVAAAIKQALEMSEAQKTGMHDSLYHFVTTHTVSTWSNRFVRRLLINLNSYSQSKNTPALDRTLMVQQYRQASKRVFMFDYDGTLTAIVKDPDAAIPSDRVLRTLKALAADRQNHVWIISGRDQAFLDNHMGHISELGLSAEHGCFIRPPGSDEWENLTRQMDMTWQQVVEDVFNYYTERTPGSHVEKKEVAVTWHYRLSDPDWGAFQAEKCHDELEHGVTKDHELEVMAGKANLEVRPRFVNKGFIASRLIREYSEDGHPPDFILCLGDDKTDEDMFNALLHTDLPPEHIFACTVGASSKQTLASWHLLEPSDVIASIAALNAPAFMDDEEMDGRIVG